MVAGWGLSQGEEVDVAEVNIFFAMTWASSLG